MYIITAIFLILFIITIIYLIKYENEREIKLKNESNIKNKKNQIINDIQNKIEKNKFKLELIVKGINDEHSNNDIEEVKTELYRLHNEQDYLTKILMDLSS